MGEVLINHTILVVGDLINHTTLKVGDLINHTILMVAAMAAIREEVMEAALGFGGLLWR
jgi:hypothetical protein